MIASLTTWCTYKSAQSVYALRASGGLGPAGAARAHCPPDVLRSRAISQPLHSHDAPVGINDTKNDGNQKILFKKSLLHIC